MTGEFEVNYRASQEMTREHRAIADDIDALAATMPEGLDGGEGTEFILNGMAALATGAGQLSQVNRAAALRLSTMVDRVQGVDDDAEGDFRTLEKAVE